MKRHYYFKGVFLVLIAMFIFSTACVYAAEESITVTTYYPSPYGVYSEMRLYPKAPPPVATVCDSTQEGLMYYDSSAHALMVCSCKDSTCLLDSNYAWISATSYWMLSETNLYPNNPAWNVGIGTTEPAAKLEISGGHLRVSGGNQAQFIESSGVHGSAIFETLVSSQGVLNIGNTVGTPHFSVNTNNGRVGIGTTTMMGFLSLARDGTTDKYVSFNAGPDYGIKRWGEVFANGQTDLTDNINGGGMTDIWRSGWGISFGDNIDAFQISRAPQSAGGGAASSPLFTIIGSSDLSENGNVGIGTTNPSGRLEVKQPSGTSDPNIVLSQSSNNGGEAPKVWFKRAMNPGSPQAGYVLGSFVYSGYAGGGCVGTCTPDGYARGGRISTVAAENWNSVSHGTYMTFEVADVGASNTAEAIRIAPSGAVGIGTTSLSGRLHVRTGLDQDIARFEQADANFGAIVSIIRTAGATPREYRLQTMTSGGFKIRDNTAGHDRIYIGPAPANDARVGIGTNSPAAALDVQTTIPGLKVGATCVSGACPSDMRLKHDITPIIGSLQTIISLKPVSFRFRDRADGGIGYGFIAQDVQKVAPEWVREGKDGYLSVDYSPLTMMLVESVKELKSENDALKARLGEVEKKLK